MLSRFATAKKGEVIAVLEIDVFESTTESKENSTKVGYITNNLKTTTLMNRFNERKFTVVLGEWLSSISHLLDD